MGDCAEIGLPDELGVFCQQPALVAGNWRAPLGAARGQLGLAGDQVHAPVRDVDPHPITIADEGEGAADGGLGRHMADADAAGSTREAAVGDDATFSPICWP